MDGTRGYHVKKNKRDTERQVSHIFSHIWIKLKHKIWNTSVQRKKATNPELYALQNNPTRVRRNRNFLWKTNLRESVA